jgi:hypothetical protein
MLLWDVSQHTWLTFSYRRLAQPISPIFEVKAAHRCIFQWNPVVLSSAFFFGIVILLGLLDPWRSDQKFFPVCRRLTINLCYVTSQKSEGLICSAAKASNHVQFQCLLRKTSNWQQTPYPLHIEVRGLLLHPCIKAALHLPMAR